ncbi:hypothetical protein DFH06DRAFT_1132228 [Mycena polygramma]|nr:hypothetical protein DFH06DRAFT_1132228 [Mycena polygramma]
MSSPSPRATLCPLRLHLHCLSDSTPSRGRYAPEPIPDHNQFYSAAWSLRSHHTIPYLPPTKVAVCNGLARRGTFGTHPRNKSAPQSRPGSQRQPDSREVWPVELQERSDAGLCMNRVEIRASSLSLCESIDESDIHRRRRLSRPPDSRISVKSRLQSVESRVLRKKWCMNRVQRIARSWNEAIASNLNRRGCSGAISYDDAQVRAVMRKRHRQSGEILVGCMGASVGPTSSQRFLKYAGNSVSKKREEWKE